MIDGPHDDTLRIAFPMTEDGGFGPPRPYTAAEIADLDTRLLREANATTLRTEVAAQVAVLLATIAALNTVASKVNADIGPADTKTLARESRALARALIRVCRIVAGVLDSTSSGG